jgi:hypothetical protein
MFKYIRVKNFISYFIYEIILRVWNIANRASIIKILKVSFVLNKYKINNMIKSKNNFFYIQLKIHARVISKFE